MFIRNIIKKVKSTVDSALDPTEEVDNRFFAAVMEEIDNGIKDKGLEGKAIAMSGGDEKKADSRYVQMRAEVLQKKFSIDQEKLIVEKEATAERLKKEKEAIAERWEKGKLVTAVQLEQERQEALDNDEISQTIIRILKEKS